MEGISISVLMCLRCYGSACWPLRAVGHHWTCPKAFLECSGFSELPNLVLASCWPCKYWRPTNQNYYLVWLYLKSGFHLEFVLSNTEILKLLWWSGPGVHLSSARGAGSIPGWGTESTCLEVKSQSIKQKQYCNKLNKYFKNKHCNFFPTWNLWDHVTIDFMCLGFTCFWVVAAWRQNNLS